MMKKVQLIGVVLFLGCQDLAEVLPLSPPSLGADAGLPALGRQGPQDYGVQMVDAGLVDAGRPDLGFLDMGSVDVGMSSRRLVQWRPLGETPVDNLVMTPMFDPLAAVAPISMTGLVERRFVARTPAMMPVLVLGPSDNVLIPVQSRPQALDVSVWLGTAGGVPSAQNAAVSLIGLGANQLELEALIDATPQTMTIGAVGWRRYEARVEQGFLGQAFMTILHLGGGDILANGPVVMPARMNLVGDPNKPLKAIKSLSPLSDRLKPALLHAHNYLKAQARSNLRPPKIRRRAFEQRGRPAADTRSGEK